VFVFVFYREGRELFWSLRPMHSNSGFEWFTMRGRESHFRPFDWSGLA